MSMLQRWMRFNAVGAMGMVVQLSLLSNLIRRMSGHYLMASAVAVEITLLHNFFWHCHFTWRDRAERGASIRRLLRFHLSNGLISIVGNLGLMWLLVREAHLPVVLSNVVAIICCSIANFIAGDGWAFARRLDLSRLQTDAGSIHR